MLRLGAYRVNTQWKMGAGEEEIDTVLQMKLFNGGVEPTEGGSQERLIGEK